MGYQDKKDLLKESRNLMKMMFNGNLGWNSQQVPTVVEKSNRFLNLPEEYKDSINGITRMQYVLNPEKYKYKVMFGRN